MSPTNEVLNQSSCILPSVVPLPPVLLDRSDNSLTFVAAPFAPQDCSQVDALTLFVIIIIIIKTLFFFNYYIIVIKSCSTTVTNITTFML